MADISPMARDTNSPHQKLVPESRMSQVMHTILFGQVSGRMKIWYQNAWQTSKFTGTRFWCGEFDHVTRALVYSKQQFTNTAEISVNSGQYSTMAQITDPEAVDGPYQGSTCSHMNTSGLLSLIITQLSASVPDYCCVILKQQIIANYHYHCCAPLK